MCLCKALACGTISLNGVVCRWFVQTLYPSFKIKDPEEKVKARQELLAGALADKLKLLSKTVVSTPGSSCAQIRDRVQVQHFLVEILVQSSTIVGYIRLRHLERLHAQARGVASCHCAHNLCECY
jgi:hypothetical protein